MDLKKIKAALSNLIAMAKPFMTDAPQRLALEQAYAAQGLIDKPVIEGGGVAEALALALCEAWGNRPYDRTALNWGAQTYLERESRVVAKVLPILKAKGFDLAALSPALVKEGVVDVKRNKEWLQGYRCAWKDAVTWLHDRGNGMNHEPCKAWCFSAAYQMGNACKYRIGQMGELKSALPALTPVQEQKT